MSHVVVSWVLDQSKSRGADRLVLLVIAEHANDNGANAYPSLTRIAKRANMDKRTAQRSIRALVASGELKVSDSTGPQGVHRYRVVMPRGWRDTTPRGETPPVTGHPGDTPPVASDPAGGGDTPPKPSVEPSLVVEPEGDRYETLRVVRDTEPPNPNHSRCTKHRNGNPTNENCHGCRADREADARAEADAKRAEAERIANCPDCGGGGWKEHPHTGLPAGKCLHVNARRTA